ncbi:MAG TPA: hydrogenase nickel incorporation protein HypB [Thermoanaerobaculia bacterium]
MCEKKAEEAVSLEVHQRILSRNDETARHNREHFDRLGTIAVNLMGSPGSGKTALLEATARRGNRRVAALAGDLETDRDAQRLAAAGIPSLPITTGSACHLDAGMVHRALHDLPLEGIRLLAIENVGNLVCPAVYDLGQHASVVALSVTEGEDKPLKYPVMFRTADLVVITKVDLLPHLDVDVRAIRNNLARVMPRPRAIEVSSRTGEGIDQWMQWLDELCEAATAPLQEARA